MTNPTLPKAVAALLPQHTIKKVELMLDNTAPFAELSLAFECLQALDDKSYRYEAFKATGAKFIRFHADPLGNIAFSGSGENTKQAIFSAVEDWYSKRVVSDVRTKEHSTGTRKRKISTQRKG